MPKIRLAIADTDEEYVLALTNYILKKHGPEIDVIAFTKTENLVERIGAAFPDLILMEPKLESLVMEKPPEGAKIRYFRTEGIQGTAFGEGTDHSIFKYQAADELVKKVMEDIGGLRFQEGTSPKNKQLHICYSPSKSRMLTPFAYSLAQMLSKQERVLYLNFSENTAFEWMLQRKFEKDLSEVFYKLAKGQKGEEILSGVVEYDEDLCLVAPMKSAFDRTEPDETMWRELLDVLKGSVSYESVVLELDSLIPGIWDYIQESERIYVVCGEDEYENARTEEFLSVASGRGVGERIVRIRHTLSGPIPYHGMNIINRWLYGEIGDLVRRYV